MEDALCPILAAEIASFSVFKGWLPPSLVHSSFLCFSHTRATACSRMRLCPQYQDKEWPLLVIPRWELLHSPLPRGRLKQVQWWEGALKQKTGWGSRSSPPTGPGNQGAQDTGRLLLWWVWEAWNQLSSLPPSSQSVESSLPLNSQYQDWSPQAYFRNRSGLEEAPNTECHEFCFASQCSVGRLWGQVGWRGD